VLGLAGAESKKGSWAAGESSEGSCWAGPVWVKKMKTILFFSENAMLCRFCLFHKKIFRAPKILKIFV
jgi:hypothetical protein